MSVFARMGDQIVIEFALYTGNAIRILIMHDKLTWDLELQMAKSLLACHKMKELHLDWTNWKVHKCLEVATNCALS